jgi:hypothetical protein
MNRNKKYRTRLALAEILDFACRITKHNFCMVLGKWEMDLNESVCKKYNEQSTNQKGNK